MRFYCCILAMVLIPHPAMADVSLAPLFTDHMVLQRDMKVPIWGSAAAGNQISVSFAGQTKSARASKDGKWRVDLEPLTASSKGQSLVVKGDGEINLTDVFVGEVWLGSGQSNMQYPMADAEDGAAALGQAMHPNVRIFQRPPGKRALDQWMVCTPETAAELSAVSYFFAQHLQQELEVPIGIIVRAVGGTTIQRWVAPESIRNNALIQNKLAETTRRAADFPRYNEEKAKYDKRNRPPPNVAKFLNEMSRLSYYRGSGNSGLYRRMIQPLQPFAIRGVIWYQGEFNNRSGQAYDYREWQACLVQGWRKNWGQGDFPFLFVQLQVLRNQTTALFRESQATTLERCPNTAMAVICDQSEGLHPSKKQIAGVRLAIAAGSLVYQSELPPMGPLLKSHRFVDGEAHLAFDHIGNQLAAKGQTLKGFFIAGADEQFHVAEATIVDVDQIVVSCGEVPQPVAVRYAWLNDPRKVMTLLNDVGLPATPFRTDTFDNTESLDRILKQATSGRGTKKARMK